MRQYLTKSLLLLIFAVILCCGIYPLALWAIGEIFFPFQANGSLLFGEDNKIVGSRLIAQAFTDKEYFHPRPSAANYDAAASASSALAPSNPELRDRVSRTLESLARPDISLQNIPADMVMSSASGLDPDITLQNAEYQLDRVAAQWAADLKRNPAEVHSEIEAILQKNAQAPLAGMAGEKFVNVLEINLQLRKQYELVNNT